MNGCATIALFTNIVIIAFSNHDFQLDLDAIVVYAKPGDAMQLKKISVKENEDLKINCGKTSHESPSSSYKISAGSAAQLGQFPWAVSLSLVNQEDFNYCGGSIISKRHILTAAHCLLINQIIQIPCISAINLGAVAQIVVRYGGICIRSYSPACDGQLCMTARIRKIAVHKGFVDTGCFGGYDFAIIELQDDLTFGTATSAICLPNSTFNLNSTENILDYGFGENEHGASMSRLQYVSAKIISEGIIDDVIEAGPIHTPRNRTVHPSTCPGDSGAGLQGSYKQRVFLLGINSFGPKLCYVGSPYKLTDTRRYAQLICHLTGICYHLSSFT